MRKKEKPGKAIKKLTSKAILAFENEFYLETTWIISMIIETRLRNILMYVEGKNPGSGYNLDRCLKRVKYRMLKGDNPILAREVGLPLPEAVRVWKNHRNKILKDMTERHISAQRFAGLAQEGIVLMQDTNAAFKKFKSAWLRPVPAAAPQPETKPEEHEKVGNG